MIIVTSAELDLCLEQLCDPQSYLTYAVKAGRFYGYGTKELRIFCHLAYRLIYGLDF